MGRHGEGRERVLEAVKALTKENGYPPTIREIMDKCGFRSTRTVHYHVNVLLEKGLLTKGPKRNRTIRIKEEK